MTDGRAIRTFPPNPKAKQSFPPPALFKRWLAFHICRDRRSFHSPCVSTTARSLLLLARFLRFTAFIQRKVKRGDAREGERAWKNWRRRRKFRSSKTRSMHDKESPLSLARLEWITFHAAILGFFRSGREACIPLHSTACGLNSPESLSAAAKRSKRLSRSQSKETAPQPHRVTAVG